VTVGPGMSRSCRNGDPPGSGSGCVGESTPRAPDEVGPVRSAIVPFGVASDGTVLNFVHRGRPSRWQVSTAQPGQSPQKFKAHDVSMTELVLGMVTGTIKIGTVKKPASPPRFVPAARAADAKAKKPATMTATTKKAASKKKGSR